MRIDVTTSFYYKRKEPLQNPSSLGRINFFCGSLQKDGGLCNPFNKDKSSLRTISVKVILNMQEKEKPDEKYILRNFGGARHILRQRMWAIYRRIYMAPLLFLFPPCKNWKRAPPTSFFLSTMPGFSPKAWAHPPQRKVKAPRSCLAPNTTWS
ncbi:unnamed protein product [Lepeophtheirus salmonis]|uniref:(salmon louse) hypothetical protein n=1 Tax=Lepeophtheirus salmonis TaxID=72036 RepID=A0A7R8D5N0_LEPSM|nr:unnamed protein product [Lepeophtheirus salmonis]CAF3037411.1 unnamed protein product [Lepeophtheirus salmonis]